MLDKVRVYVQKANEISSGVTRKQEEEGDEPPSS